MRAYHKKPRNVLEDSARKIGKWIVEIAKSFNVLAILLEDLNDLIKSVKKRSPRFRDKLYLMQYRRLQTGLSNILRNTDLR
ncbi:IS200/IS605 family element transposase accessory protein TnpB [Metallosphaera tengchongensis]|uniref:IS200/IS605 family element transposase accessory protein TnpB n=1 Tax=Metallosphaera tengchongensis TaxID=1532350 RepID=A0A6N0P107_9CREN|nr:IS200/IS605 family element transposase accessory protein TnpB [Metallosphaera tengchongensis]